MPYVLFEANNDFSLILNGVAFDGHFEFSDDGREWNEVTKNEYVRVKSKDGKLFFRGKGNRYFKNIGRYDSVFGLGTKDDKEITVSGNILSLIDYETVEKGKEPVMGGGAFFGLFSGLPIIDASCLILPSLELSENCYSCMFERCDKLVKPPKLPATKLAKCCYSGMFYDCERLEYAPELLATELADCCYSGMFRGCKSLKDAPALPATKLAEWCYESMFWDCISLKEAPELPAKTLATHCYESMFFRCKGLTSAPKLPATTLANGCYVNMFNACIGLTIPPKLPAINLKSHCYASMFYGCKWLVEVPELPATTLADGCYVNMFASCSSIKLSDVKGKGYSTPFCIASENSDCAVKGMFAHNGGTYNKNIKVGKTYYLKTDDLSEKEEALCTLLESGYLARESSGILNYYKKKPVKGERYWKGEMSIKCINDLFPQCEFSFITWNDNEPWEI